jgi:predicted membrane channel-forming protein YqfA (hemolysin III family)
MKHLKRLAFGGMFVGAAWLVVVTMKIAFHFFGIPLVTVVMFTGLAYLIGVVNEPMRGRLK